MLKNCFLPINYNLSNKTCGEIICQSETSFAIICKLCDIKIFDYEEFIQHFRNKHWPEIIKTPSPNKQEQIEVACDVLYGEAHEVTDTIIKTEKPSWDEEEEEELIEEFRFANEEEEIKDEDWQENDGKYEGSDISEEYDEEDLEPIAILKKKTKAANRKHKPFKCNKCNRTFALESSYEAHVEKHEINDFKCDQCDKSFVKEEHLTHHRRSHQGHPCNECDKVFEKHESLRYHKETHIKTKNFVCDYQDCTKAFANQRRLNSHKRLHFSPATYVCEVCGSCQRSKKALQDHIRTHTGEKPFGCNMCDRRFTSKSLLNEHKACHESERKHICNVCGKSFNRQKALYHHKHLHLDVKKFVCKICGSAFAQAAGLSAHMRKHKEENFTTEANKSAPNSHFLNVLFPF